MNVPDGIREAAKMYGILPRHPKPPEFNQTAEWLHPAYVMRRIDVGFSTVQCPATHSGLCNGFHWKLDKNLYMIPDITLHDPEEEGG